MNTLITNNNYIDRHGNDWLIQADKDIPVIKQHMDKIIDVALQAKQLFKRPIAYHFWVRINHGRTITQFVDLLKKHYLRRVKLKIEYIRVEEEDKIKHLHHHFYLFVDKTFTHEQSLPVFLAKNNRSQ